jgi:large subunit ribosomal protein L24
MNTLHVKKNDMVVVLAGEDKGKAGKVLATDPGKRRVLVEGVNIVHKAMRKSQENPKGGILTKEAPIPAGKVMLQSRYDARRKKHPAAAPATQPQL